MDVGIIGTGVMGLNHVRVYSKIRNIDNIYVYDLHKSNYDILKNHDLNFCKTPTELYNKVDAVSLCVPTDKHHDLLKNIFDHNIHCLVEKPITLNYEEGLDLINTFHDDLILGVGHIERFNPIINEIKKVVKDICYCDIKRHNPGSNRIKDSNVIKDLMIHDIDIVFNELFKDKKYQLNCGGNQDYSSCLFDFNESIVNISASRLSSKKIRSIYIEEETLTLEGDFMQQEVYVYRKPEQYSLKDDRYVQENIIEKVLVNKVEPLFVELKTFIDCIRNKKQFPVTLKQALNNLKICEEIEEKIKCQTTTITTPLAS